MSHEHCRVFLVSQLCVLYNYVCALILFCIMMPTDSGVDQAEVVAELLKELSNHSERVEERKAALCELMRLIRETQLHVWDEHFKTILLLLLETLGDGEVRTEDVYTHNFIQLSLFRFTEN